MFCNLVEVWFGMDLDEMKRETLEKKSLPTNRSMFRYVCDYRSNNIVRKKGNMPYKKLVRVRGVL
ncbi:hypothetical protein G4O51_01650 [Candidatus Bathyarchaeota archaeon A05DMB-2]|nr:hypothetical protein [Candidatus Bathyarchaeota archaeon A05DMB-2]